MKRREVLGVGIATILGGGLVGTTLGYGPLASTESPQPEYLGRAPIVYERDQLQLSASQAVIRRGETITFEITHTGQSKDIVLGCGNPWAIQVNDDGEWDHAVWTPGRYYNGCATLLGQVERGRKQSPCRTKH